MRNATLLDTLKNYIEKPVADQSKAISEYSTASQSTAPIEREFSTRYILTVYGWYECLNTGLFKIIHTISNAYVFLVFTFRVIHDTLTYKIIFIYFFFFFLIF